MLGDRGITFISRAVRCDLAKIGVHFNCTATIKDVNYNGFGLNGQAARGGEPPSEHLGVFGFDGARNYIEQTCAFVKVVPSTEQVKYAVLDVIVALRKSNALMKLPGLSKRLAITDIEVDRMVDIIFSRGSLVTMSTRCFLWLAIIIVTLMSQRTRSVY